MLDLITTRKKEGENEIKDLKKSVNQKRSKRVKASKFTIDEQVTCFAEIICTQLLKEMNLYEKD